MSEKKVFASFYERTLAKLIDSLIYSMLILLPVVSISASSGFSNLLDSSYNFILLILVIAVLVLPLEMLMVSRLGGTPGKLILGIKIQKENGKRLNFWEAFVRSTIGRAVSGLFFGLGYFWVCRNEKRQGWHDLIIDSVVVRTISYGWMMGLLIFVVFLIINICLFASSAMGFIGNSKLYLGLFS